MIRKLIVLLILATVTVACSTTSRSKSAKTLLVVGESVNAAMNVYGELYREGELSGEDIERVRETHAKFQVLYSQAVRAVEFDLGELAPAELALLASDLILVIDTL